ncbi:MAG: hypothetical protein JW967_10765 [Dehalococcoidales bacterium]|nr:hypothetical protein [Dehalococcoidales bacterium]
MLIRLTQLLLTDDDESGRKIPADSRGSTAKPKKLKFERLYQAIAGAAVIAASLEINKSILANSLLSL